MSPHHGIHAGTQHSSSKALLNHLAFRLALIRLRDPPNYFTTLNIAIYISPRLDLCKVPTILIQPRSSPLHRTAMAEISEANAAQLSQNSPDIIEPSTGSSNKLDVMPEPASDTARLVEAIERLNLNQESLALVVKQALKHVQDEVESDDEDSSQGRDDEGGEVDSAALVEEAVETLHRLLPTPERMVAMLDLFIQGLCLGNTDNGYTGDQPYGPYGKKPEAGIDPIIELNTVLPSQVSWGPGINIARAEVVYQLKRQWPSADNFLPCEPIHDSTITKSYRTSGAILRSTTLRVCLFLLSLQGCY